MSFNIGNLVKLNPDLFPEGVKDDDLLGTLGYPGIFRHLLFEVEKVENDPNRGEIAHCRVTNPEILKYVVPGVKSVNYEGSLVILTSDAQLANTRVTLLYELKGTKSKDDIIKELFVERRRLESQGQKKSAASMRENWRKIQILRGEIKGDAKIDLGKVTAYIPKLKLTVDVAAKDVPNDTEESKKKFEQLLANKVRQVRRERRVNKSEVKKVFNQSVEKLGGVYLKERSLLAAYEEFMKTTLETDKKPVDTKSTYFGIEIEMIYSGKYEVLKKLLIENKLHKYVTLKTDGSLRACHNTNYQTSEMTILVRKQDLEDVMKRLDAVLLHPEIDGYANRSCGLHVHLDMRKETKRDPNLVYKNLVRIQSILRGAQPVGRIRNTHCRPNTTEEFRFEEGRDERQNRYSVVNGEAYARHNSIEIRIHEGTTDCESIYNWAMFLGSIADYKKEIPKNEIKYAEDLSARFDINIPLSSIAYVDERIKRFNSLAVS